MLLREQSRDLVRVRPGLSSVHLADEVLHIGERDLLDGQVRRPVGRSPVDHDRAPLDPVAVAREGRRVSLARTVVPDQHRAVPIAGLAEDPIGHIEERLRRHVIELPFCEEEVELKRSRYPSSKNAVPRSRRSIRVLSRSRSRRSSPKNRARSSSAQGYARTTVTGLIVLGID